MEEEATNGTNVEADVDVFDDGEATVVDVAVVDMTCCVGLTVQTFLLVESFICLLFDT